MSDIIFSGRYKKFDKDGRAIAVTRVRRFVENKYSSQYRDARALLDEKQALERTINEKKTSSDPQEKAKS